MKIDSFQDLDVWNVAMDTTEKLYRIISMLPATERFELASQMRRAAVSVPSNVAEGHATGLQRRYLYHARVALGSVGELTTCIELCRRFKYISDAEAEKMQKDLARTRQLLHGVLRSLLAKIATQAVRTGLAVIGFWSLFGT
jgi:four helix bundle protein